MAYGMTQREARSLDDYITGHYGEDQFEDAEPNVEEQIAELYSDPSAEAMAQWEQAHEDEYRRAGEPKEDDDEA